MYALALQTMTESLVMKLAVHARGREGFDMCVGGAACLADGIRLLFNSGVGAYWTKL